MEMTSVIHIFKELGWSCKKDEVGDSFCIKSQGDIFIQIIPSISKRRDHFRVSLMPSISTAEFSRAAAFIMGSEVGFMSIVVSNIPVNKLSKLERSDIVRLSNEALDWASTQDVQNGLREYKKLPTNSKGVAPLKHLTSLALAGDASLIKSYIDSFESGDRLGFVPYITADMLSRALALASPEFDY